MWDVVIDAVMDNAKADTIEIDNFVILVVHFRRTAQELRAGRSQIRTAAGGCIVAGAGRRRSRMEVLGLGERLPDQTGAHNFSIDGQEAAVGLGRKYKLRHTGHYSRIQQTSDNGENQS